MSFFRHFLPVAAVWSVVSCDGPRCTVDPFVEGNRTLDAVVAAIEQHADSTVIELEIHGDADARTAFSPDWRLRGGKTGKAAGTERRLLRPAPSAGGKLQLPAGGVARVRLVFEPLAPETRFAGLLETGGGNRRIERIALHRDVRPAGALRCRIEGEVRGRPGSTLLYLYEHIDGDESKGSQPAALIPVREGRFACELTLDEPDYCTLVFAEEKRKGCWTPIDFVADAGTIRMTLHADGLEARNRIEGGGQTAAYEACTRRLRAIDERARSRHDSLLQAGALYTPAFTALYKRWTAGDTSAALLDEMNRLSCGQRHYSPEGLALIASHKRERRDSLLGMLDAEISVAHYALLARQMAYDLPEEPILERFERYAAAMPDHYLTACCRRRIDGFRMGVGSKAADFEAPDLEGRMHRFSTLTADARIAVLDLWASWCGPCRTQSKAMIPLYERYRERGLAIVGVARESGGTGALRRALERDRYPWPTLVELDDRTHLWARYGCAHAAGRIFVFDARGTILAVDPSVEELERLLIAHTEP